MGLGCIKAISHCDAERECECVRQKKKLMRVDAEGPHLWRLSEWNLRSGQSILPLRLFLGVNQLSSSIIKPSLSFPASHFNCPFSLSIFFLFNKVKFPLGRPAKLVPCKTTHSWTRKLEIGGLGPSKSSFSSPRLNKIMGKEQQGNCVVQCPKS